MSNITAIKIISSLEKIYDSDKMPQTELKRFSMLKNEKKSFQVALEADSEGAVDFKINCELKNVRVYTVEHIRSDFPMWKKGADDYYRFSESGYYPDLL
ncbi:MAG: hypothetical protein IKB94_06235, partial [Clostridia bacterium]|nr:hypothetical protein [Clostridia bacterium]